MQTVTVRRVLRRTDEIQLGLAPSVVAAGLVPSASPRESGWFNRRSVSGSGERLPHSCPVQRMIIASELPLPLESYIIVAGSIAGRSGYEEKEQELECQPCA